MVSGKKMFGKKKILHNKARANTVLFAWLRSHRNRVRGVCEPSDHRFSLGHLQQLPANGQTMSYFVQTDKGSAPTEYRIKTIVRFLPRTSPNLDQSWGRCGVGRTVRGCLFVHLVSGLPHLSTTRIQFSLSLPFLFFSQLS